ncbi:MAG TPA: Trm112 family protein [Terriglobales bacterium]
MTIAPELLEILVCPQCHVQVTPAQDGLFCPQCKRLFPVMDGIPVMLLDQAKQIG